MKKHQKALRLVLATLLILAMVVSCNAFSTENAPTSTPASDSLANEATSVAASPSAPLAGTDEKAEKSETALALETAKANNSDTAAWLCVPSTRINNPVMQTTNNSDYLSANENGEYDGWGCYFADYYANLAAPDCLIENTVIYGHAQSTDDPEGKRFTQLFHYTDIAFLQQNPYLFLTVADETLTFQIFAVFYTGIDFYYINPTPSAEGFDAFINTVNAKNEYKFPDITVTAEDKLLTLSTCSHKYDTAHTRNHRFVVMGKLVDSPADDAPNVLLNEFPERP